MANVNMVRVDYRLIHGQIVAKWIKFRPVDRLVLADDTLYNDPFMSDIYKMSAPGKIVDIIRLEDVKAHLEEQTDSIMLIFRTVNNAFEVSNDGYKFTELNVGAVQSTKDRKTVIQGVALSDEELLNLKNLDEAGVNIYFQPIPENDPITLYTIEKKMK